MPTPQGPDPTGVIAALLHFKTIPCLAGRISKSHLRKCIRDLPGLGLVVGRSHSFPDFERRAAGTFLVLHKLENTLQIDSVLRFKHDNFIGSNCEQRRDYQRVCDLGRRTFHSISIFSSFLVLSYMEAMIIIVPCNPLKDPVWELSCKVH